MKKDFVIILFGFSGSGKSALADMIGKHYQVRIVHPSSILRSLLEKTRVDIVKTKAGTGFWESPSGMKLLKSRLTTKQPMDVLSDQILLTELAKGNIVMDSWSMPWLYPKGVKIYLKTSFAQRVKRVAHRSGISIDQARTTVRAKDTDTRALFKRVYGFDIQKDHEVFDLVIDTTQLTIDQVLTKIITFLETKTSSLR